MSNRIQALRSNTAGVRPATGTALQGVFSVNWADKQITVMDSGKNAIDLVAVRYFSTSANYAVGDFTIQGGQLYRAIAPSTPGAFVSANWSQVAAMADLVLDFLPLSGGTITGALQVNGNEHVGGIFTVNYNPPTAFGAAPGMAFFSTASADQVAFNAYLGSDSQWHNHNGGTAGLIAYSQSGGPFSFYTSPSVAAGALAPAWSVGATLDNSGTFTAQQLISNGNTITRGVTYFNYNAATDWYTVVGGSNRIMNWATNWYDYWSAADGSRHWVNAGIGDLMTLSSAGDLWTRGQLNVGGPIITPATVQGANVNAISGGTWGSVGCGSFSCFGNASITGTVTAGYLHSTGTVDGTTVHSTGALQVDGSGQINGNLNVSGTLSAGTMSFGDINYSGQLISSSFYGHGFKFGWNGAGARVAIDGGDQGYLIRGVGAPHGINIVSIAPTAAGGYLRAALDDGTGAIWSTVAGLMSDEEAIAKFEADAERLKTLVETVDNLLTRVAALEARLNQ